jgi:predicted kinase
MSKPKLYLFIGYPGAGKTTTSKIIAEKTGAVHLWADMERHKRFENPSHSKAESDELYARLNEEADQLLAQGKSVIFDTNFNYYSDRQLLREIADRHGADTIVIWVQTPENIARQRAVGSHQIRNYYTMNMTDEQFDSIVSKLEPPRENEKVIKIDGANFGSEQITHILGL